MFHAGLQQPALSPAAVAVLLLHPFHTHDHFFYYKLMNRKRTAHRGGKKKEMIDHRELNFISHFSMRGHENRYLLSYCKGVEKNPESFLYGFYLIYFCACVCLHSATIRVLTHTERVKRVLESFT